MNPMQEVQEIVSASVQVAKQAFAQLVAEGFSREVADARVKANFDRVNADSRLVLTVEELVKPI